MIMNVPQIISSLFRFIGEKSFSNASSVIQYFIDSHRNGNIESKLENQEKIDANWVFILDSKINESKKNELIKDIKSIKK